MKNHHMNLKGAVESLTERVKQMHDILLGMKQGDIRYDPVLVRSFAEFADKLPAADQLVNFSREQEQAQRDSMVNALLAVIMAGSASSMSCYLSINARKCMRMCIPCTIVLPHD